MEKIIRGNENHAQDMPFVTVEAATMNNVLVYDGGLSIDSARGSTG